MTTNRSKRPGRPTGLALLDRLVKEAQSTFHTWHVPEPPLIFGGRRECEDPKSGITLFGPAQLDHAPRSPIRVGVVGTGDSIQMLKNWVNECARPVRAGFSSSGKPYDTLLAPTFPGFGEDTSFQCRVEIDDRHIETIPRAAIERAIDDPRFERRVESVVALVIERLLVLGNKDPQPDVVVCAMPKEIEAACGPEARAARERPKFLTKTQKAERRRTRKDLASGQRHLEFGEDGSPAISQESNRYYQDFHHALKARAMVTPIPTQLVWESTLRRTRGTQDPATVAWNFFTALYYKAGNIPWELAFTGGSTCYVGISFYRDGPDPDAPTRTSLAQAFSETGEGIVLRGDPITWDKERDRKPHLSYDAAKSLMSQVMELYTQHFSVLPRRVVVHKTSRYWDEERRGLRDALSSVPSYDFLALERRGFRFFRLGSEPPVRGTAVELGPQNYLLFTRGYVPFLRAYPGLRVPNPLEVVEHYGDSAADRVCSELLALTKLNWNTSAFASADPITIGFSRDVAKIIKELPPGVLPQFKYRYYM